MPPKKQLKLEDMPPKVTRKTAAKPRGAATKGPEKAPASRKRKAEDEPQDTPPAKSGRLRKAAKTEPETKPAPSPANAKKARTAKAAPAKKTKQAELSTAEPGTLDSPIVINRAPVLELWSACVAQLLHPDLSWNACLAIGGSIATITAISKGRSIGTVAPKDSDGDGSKKTPKEKGANVKEVKVMGFPMEVRGDAVIVKGKPKEGKEDALARKFGEGNLEKVKQAMKSALAAWKGKEQELDEKAFHMYEQFRPDVAKGQKGWGRKGELHLSKIESVVKK
jgi:hypothetical protein